MASQSGQRLSRMFDEALAGRHALGAQYRDLSDVPCEFQEFKHVLMEMRKVDDKISYALNLTDVVREDERLSCGKIWDGIWTIHAERSQLIQRCVKEQSEVLAQAKQDGDKRKARILGAHLSLMKSEMRVENATHEYARNQFKAKCKSFKIPPHQADCFAKTNEL